MELLERSKRNLLNSIVEKNNGYMYLLKISRDDRI